MKRRPALTGRLEAGTNGFSGLRGCRRLRPAAAAALALTLLFLPLLRLGGDGTAPLDLRATLGRRLGRRTAGRIASPAPLLVVFPGRLGDGRRLERAPALKILLGRWRRGLLLR